MGVVQVTAVEADSRTGERQGDDPGGVVLGQLQPGVAKRLDLAVFSADFEHDCAVTDTAQPGDRTAESTREPCTFTSVFSAQVSNRYTTVQA